MFCPNCGKELSDDASFCGGCGSQISSAQNSSNKNEASSKSQGGATKVSAQAAQSAQDIASSAATTAKATASAVGSAVKTNPKVFIGIGAAVIVVIIGIVLAVMFMTGGFTGGQTAATFRQAFEAQKPYTYSLPSSTYSNDDTYDLTTCDVTDIQKKTDDWITAKIDAVLENDTYKVMMQFNADCYNYPNASQQAKSDMSNYEFSEIALEIEAKTGITKDEKNGLNNITSEMNEDGTTCTATSDETYDFWFADSSVNNVYYYSLQDLGWQFEDDVVTHNVTYKDIDGTYAAKSGDMLEFSSIAISSLNPETGSFTIALSLPEKASSYSTRLAAEASLTATIEPERPGNNSMKDGYTYRFEATGTSNGGNGKASFIGYFIVNEDGSKAIKIEKGSIDTTSTHNIGDPTSGSFSFSGTIYKQ